MRPLTPKQRNIQLSCMLHEYDRTNFEVFNDLTFYSLNYVFRIFLRYNHWYFPTIYWLIDAALIENFFFISPSYLKI